METIMSSLLTIKCDLATRKKYVKKKKKTTIKWLKNCFENWALENDLI